MKKAILSISVLLFSVDLLGQFEESVIELEPKPWGPLLWHSTIPDSSPVPQSEELVAIEFTGRHADYTYADTWYPSWASDDNMYSPYTDGVSGIWGLARSDHERAAVSGQAKIKGDNPLALTITSLGAYPGSSVPYGGRYPSATLVHNGIWYYGTYCLDAKPEGYNWGTMGPFVGFRISVNNN